MSTTGRIRSLCDSGNVQINAAVLAAEGSFAGRLLAALDKAQSLGGDARGVQSAGLLVVGAQRDGSPWNGIIHEERVDDSCDPLAELRLAASGFIEESTASFLLRAR
jgi:uncharacterized Ntn-hydrolase superfamily protein